MSISQEIYPLADDDRALLLARLAMAWDGQWFLKVNEEFGWETAAGLNARVRRAFGRIEMLLMLRTLGKSRADDLQDAARILQTYYDRVLAAGFSGTFQVEGNVLKVEVDRCAALDGSRRAGLERQDQACLGCLGLFNAYLETLLRGEQTEVEIVAQMGYGAERCVYIIRPGKATQAK